MTATAATITTAAIPAAAYCLPAATGSASFPVAFTTTGTFTGPFKVQLSDAAGLFPANTSGNIIGSSSSPITATLPANTPSGTGYRLRVVNDGPATYGSDSGADLAITLAPATNALTVAPNGGHTVSSTGGGAVAGGQGTEAIQINWDNTPGIYQLSVTYGSGLSCSVQTSVMTVTVYDAGAGFVTGGGWFDSPRNPALPYMQAAGRA